MKKILIILLLLCVPLCAFSQQQIKSMEFKNQDVRDILLALGEFNNISIIPDETVEGKVSYVFSNMDFEQALKLFLDSFHFNYIKKNGIYYISKISIIQNPKGSIDLSVTDVSPKALLRVISNTLSKTILYDNIPPDPISINIKDASLEDILNIVAAKYADFTLDKQEKYFYFRSKVQTNGSGKSQGIGGITKNGDLYNIKVDKGRFKDLLLSFFNLSGKEFILLLDRDTDIQNLYLKDKTFDETLKTLLLMGNGDFTISSNIYYIYEIQRKDLMKKYLTNLIVPLTNISSADLTKLMPASLTSGAFKLDEKGNKVILSGSLEEIKPILDFLSLVDVPQNGPLPLRVDLDFLKTDEFIPLLPADFSSFQPQALPSKTSFLISLPESKRQSLLDFVHLVDRPTMGYPVHLKFLKSDDLVSKLPPSVVEANIAKTNNNSLIFFKGTLKQRQEFLKDLQEIDIPKPQIRYELMVLQFEEDKGFNLTSEVTMEKSSSAKNLAFTGDFTNIMTMNIDVISSFGYAFALNLTAQLTNNDTKVLADTTLNGLSGEKLSFQNTNTTRYNDSETSTTSGTTTTTTVVRELTSGLLVSLEGWISADNMITLKIDSTLSKEVDSDSSSNSTTTSTTTLPSTTEKKLSTTVRTPSGKPIIISGLKQDDITYTINKTPLLGDIPFLGYLFQKRVETVDHTEFAIYLVPILERPDKLDVPEDAKLMGFYHRLEKNAL